VLRGRHTSLQLHQLWVLHPLAACAADQHLNHFTTTTGVTQGHWPGWCAHCSLGAVHGQPCRYSNPVLHPRRPHAMGGGIDPGKLPTKHRFWGALLCGMQTSCMPVRLTCVAQRLLRPPAAATAWAAWAPSS